MKSIILLSVLLFSFSSQARDYICEDGLRVEFSSSVGSPYSKVVTAPKLQDWKENYKMSYDIDADSDLDEICRCLGMSRSTGKTISKQKPRQEEFAGVTYTGRLAGYSAQDGKLYSQTSGSKLEILHCSVD